VGAAEKQAAAVELRKRGKTYRDIGEELGCSHQQAHKYVRKALARIREKTDESAIEVRTLELERLNAMVDALWFKVELGDTYAVDSALKIMKRRADLLGLDAPTRVADVTDDRERIRQEVAEAMLDPEKRAAMRVIAGG
jgi:transcriptional regulator